MRYDLFVSKKLNISKNKAKELILREQILLNNKFFKPAFNVAHYAFEKFKIEASELLSDERLSLLLLEGLFVSRAAFKLKHFLDTIRLDLKNKNALDIGAAAGGFTQVLLLKGVKSVLALDVGTKQFDENLRKDERVRVLENMNLKHFQSDIQFDVITCDVSFISLKKLVFKINELAKADIIVLFKPQFEVGLSAKRDKKGVITDTKAILKVRAEFEKECATLGWILKASATSNLKGKEGNVEYFYHFEKGL